MPDLTLAVDSIALHDQALAAGTVTTVTVTPRTAEPPNLIRLFNRGAAPIFYRFGSTVAAQDSQARLLEAGASLDLRFSDTSAGQIALISPAAGSFTIERRHQSNVYRNPPGAGGSGGGGTDVSALNKETTQAAVRTATEAVRDALNTGTAHTDSAAILAKLPATPSTRASAAAAVADTALVVIPSPNAAPTRIAGADGAAVASQANPLLVRQRGGYALTTDDLAQAVNATSTNLAASDGVDLQSISIAVLVLTAYTGTLAFEVSNDGTNWSGKTLVRADTGAALATQAGSTQAAGQWFVASGDLGARYVRVRQTAYTSGQVRVIAVASALSTSTIPQQAVALLAGSADIGRVKVTDGNATASIKIASTAVLATDPALAVSLSPNSPLPGGSLATVLGSIGAAGQFESGSLAALNASAGGSLDLATHGQVQVQVTGTFSGTVTFEVSVDGTNWVSKMLTTADVLSRQSTAGAPLIAFGHIGARYFRVRMSAYTSGTAVVTIRYNAAPGEMPITTVAARLGANAASDGIAGANVDEVALGAFNNSTIDRLMNAVGLQASGNNGRALAVASGTGTNPSVNAAAAPTSGTPSDYSVTRAAHTIQVDVTTTAPGTAGAHSVVLEGSLDGTYYTTLATVAPASTSTTATDATNHAAASVGNAPWRYVRARWASIPTSWAGTLTARVASA